MKKKSSSDIYILIYIEYMMFCVDSDMSNSSYLELFLVSPESSR